MSGGPRTPGVGLTAAAAAGAYIAKSDAVPVRRLITDLPSGPIWAPHRGGSNIHPENDLRSFRACRALGLEYINIDVVLLSDGQLAVIHDTTVDRTTTGTGNVSAFTAATYRALSQDASAWFGPGWGDTIPATLNDVLADIGGRSTLFIEAVNTGTGAPVAALVSRYGLTKSVAVSSSFTAELAPCTAAGIETWLIDSAGATSAASLIAQGINGICLRTSSVTTAQVNAYRAAGIKVELHTVTRQSEVAAFAGCDVNVWACDEPLYAQGDVTKYRRTTDPFAAQAFYHGMVPSSDNAGTPTGDFLGFNTPNGASSLRGYFPGGVRYGFQASEWVLQGWGCPLANAAASWQMDLTVTYDVLGSDSSRWAGIFICAPDDRSFNNGALAAGNNGYLILMRENGTLELTPIVAGVAGTTQTVSSTAITVAGNTAKLRINVTPTTVTVARTDVAASLSLTSSAFRGGYFHFGMSANGGNKFSFSNVTIS